MNVIWVAYNRYGDLVAQAYGYERLLVAIAYAGYAENEVLIGKASA